MKIHAFARKMRLLAISGLAIYALSIGVSHARNASADRQAVLIPNQALIVDGSESTGTGKPKPHSRLADVNARLLIADGSESTGGGKPPKPKNA